MRRLDYDSDQQKICIRNKNQKTEMDVIIMISRKESAEIIERATESLKKGGSLYEILFGHIAPENTTTECDNITIVNRIIGLCDTSNMIELPIDKDGKVIHVGDIVYYGSTIYMVKKIIYNGNEWEIQFFDDKLCISIYAEPNDLTHKKPVTIKSLVKKLTDIVAADYGTPMVVKRKLSDIADQLESLGDNNE